MNKALFAFIKVAFLVMLLLLIIYGTAYLCRLSYDYGYRFFSQSPSQETQLLENTEG